LKQGITTPFPKNLSYLFESKIVALIEPLFIDSLFMSTAVKPVKSNGNSATKHNKPAQFKPNVLQMAERAKENGNSSQAEGEQVQLKTNFFGEPSFNQPNSTVQARLKMGSVGDKYEKEADSVADRVVSNNDPKSVNKAPAPPVQLSRVKPGDLQKKESAPEEEVQAKEKTEEPVQMKCSSCGEDSVQTKLGADSDEPVQMKCAACGKADEEKSIQKQAEAEEPVQMKCSSCGEESIQAKLSSKTEEPVQMKCSSCGEESVQKKGTDGASGNIESTLASSKGGGSKMDNDTQSTMESGIGADFSGVKIHTDSNAVQMNQNLGAKAFTNGSDVYFNKGEYDPESKSGQHLLAHELTHTVQQGAASQSVQQKTESPNEEVVQEKSDLSIQKEEAAVDPCAKKKEDDKEKPDTPPEDSKSTKDCKTKYIKPPQPADGQKEPEGEEQAKDIEAVPKAGPEERQKAAPPVDGKKKEEAEAPPENPLEICAKRDEKKAEKEKAKGQKPKEEEPVKEEGGEPGKGGKEKKGKKQKDLSDQLIPQGKKKPLKQKGEMASLPLVMQRMKNAEAAAAAMGGVRGIQNTIRARGNTPLNFSNEGGVNIASANAMANAFYRDKTSRADALIENGLNSVEGMRSDTAEKRKTIEADVRKKKRSSKSFFRRKSKQAIAQATKAKAGLNKQHQLTVGQISIKAMTDKALLLQRFETLNADITAKHIAQVIALNVGYGKSYWNHINIGKNSSKKAKEMGKTMSNEYRNGKGASKKKRDLVKNKKADGFWDGYLTYNQYMARADSALESGKQYQEGMIESGKEKADYIMCQKGQQLKIMKAIADQGRENLKCATDDAMEAIELRKTATVGQADAARAEFTKNIDAALKGTLDELKQKEVNQDLILNDYGARQVVALENMSMTSIIGMLNGIEQLAADLDGQLQNFAAGVQGNQAPEEKAYQEELLLAGAKFEMVLQSTSAGIGQAVSAGKSSINDGFRKAMNAVSGVYENGIQDGTHLFNTYSALILAADAKRTEFFTQHLATSIAGLQVDLDQGAARMDSVALMIGAAYEHLLTGLMANLVTSEKGLQEGMDKTIQEDLRATICAEAETAAEAVQPWWKSVLKVLLVILVIVLVVALTLVTGGAFLAIAGPIAGALGGGVLMTAVIAGAIAGAVFGALASFLITLGMNVINLAGTGNMTWEAAFKGTLDAAITGAIAGFFGGMAGPLAGALAKGVGLLAQVGRVLLVEGIEIVFDLVGGILGDLVLYGEVRDWGAILFSAVVARGIANGVKVVPVIKAKFKGPKTDVETGGVKPKVEAETGKPKVEAETGKPKVEAEGGKTNSTSKPGDPPGTMRNKNGRLIDSKTKRFVKDPNAQTKTKTPKKKLGDEADLENTRTKNTLSDKEFDTEMGAVKNRMPGKVIDQEIDGIKYKQEVELSNGHKWRQRSDGGWCRFSKRKCYPVGKTGKLNEPFWKSRRTQVEGDSGLKNHASKHSDLSTKEYYKRGLKNIEKGELVKGGGSRQGAKYYIRKVGDDSYSITITNKKGGILSIDTWASPGGTIPRSKIESKFVSDGIAFPKNFWSRFD
jgi:hypothetical protein